MIDLDNCRFVVYGFTHKTYDTMTHIMEAFNRTLHKMGKDVIWIDQEDDISRFDLSDTFFITEHRMVLHGLPIRDDCFYAIHGGVPDPRYPWVTGSPEAKAIEIIATIKNRVTWNIYHDLSHNYNHNDEAIWLDEEIPFYPNEKHMEFRWASNLMPDEIEANKPDHILGLDSNVIHWVGTTWWLNGRELANFQRACDEGGVKFVPVGAGQRGVISIEENIRLIRQSFFAPAILGGPHIAMGLVTCRIFKNISYGQYGVTNSERAHQVLGNSCIYNPDPYQLFFDARDQLSSMDVKHLHNQMDLVAKKHTYVNRLAGIMKAAKLVMQ